MGRSVLSMDIEKERIQRKADSLKDELIDLSHFIHDHPEIGLTEYQAVQKITETLHAHGIPVNQNICGLDTAFFATVEGNRPGPHVAFFAEYDALPGIGHGCGHNIIATCAVGAFLSLCDQMKDLPGKISLFGTPDEENTGGKKVMLEKGAFDTVDYALMIHPTISKAVVHRPSRAHGKMKINFYGKSSHSAKPQVGINALSAVLTLFNAIDRIRPTLESTDNINGIITNGGRAANIIPEEAECQFSLRSVSLFRVNILIEKVKHLAECAANMIGATVKIDIKAPSPERFSNRPMCEVFKANMEALGEPMEFADPNGNFGSSDMNTVSVFIPVIHDYLLIYKGRETINGHSAEFAKAAVSERADQVCILGAKGLAMTALDILTDASLRERIDAYHRAQVPSDYLSQIDASCRLKQRR